MIRARAHVLAFRLASFVALACLLGGFVAAMWQGPEMVLVGLGGFILWRWARPSWHDYDSEGETKE